jgi:hypothetical protein
VGRRPAKEKSRSGNGTQVGWIERSKIVASAPPAIGIAPPLLPSKFSHDNEQAGCIDRLGNC